MKKIHHSLSDWDYKSPTYLTISDVQYVSSPSSLCSGGSTAGGATGWIILKSTLAPCLKEGRIVTHERRRSYTGDSAHLLFRVQALPVNNYPQNCYKAFNTGTTWTIGRYLAGAWSTLASGAISPALPYGSWMQTRLTWWEIITADLSSYLRILYEAKTNGEWFTLGQYDHAANLWSDSAVNLVGLWLSSGSLPNSYFVDDTEIWKVAE